MKDQSHTQRANEPCNRDRPRPVPRINSETLLAGANRLLIQHRGVDYLLQLTRQGKLILTK